MQYIIYRIYELNAEHSYVIMEDLGYRKQKRINSLSVDHFKVTFGKLARMHAASLFLNPSVRDAKKTIRSLKIFLIIKFHS